MDILFEFFLQAVEANASDIHLKVGQSPIYRLEGQLYKAEAPPVTSDQLMELINEILSPALKEQFDRDQEADFAWSLNENIRFRANLFASNGDPTLALRYVKSAIHTFETLNLPPQLGELAMRRQGIILLGGTTGSGKSTTLAAMIQYINDREFRRMITIEDPIEYLFTDKMSVISQREVGFDTNSFGTGLRAAMRQDPDVIMVGEIRDRDSVETAIAAAETGHLIFSTIHTDNSAQSILRIMDMFPADERGAVRQALANTLAGVICQRLIPDMSGKARPAAEIMINTPIVRKLIAEENVEKLAVAIEAGGEDGMQSFNQALYGMVEAGHINEEIALRNATNPEALRMNLRGIFLDTSSRIVGT